MTTGTGAMKGATGNGATMIGRKKGRPCLRELDSRGLSFFKLEGDLGSLVQRPGSLGEQDVPDGQAEQGDPVSYILDPIMLPAEE